MQVFIMWAGDKSHLIAKELKKFLQFVVRGPNYFISDDIQGGMLWRKVLANNLEDANFGIACLTGDNLHNHWLHFEAGAISKAVGQARVVPLLFGPNPTDVDGPLSDFQIILGDKDGLYKLVSILASHVPNVPDEIVDESFTHAWQKFESILDMVHSEKHSDAIETDRSEKALLQEVLSRVRRLESGALKAGKPPRAEVQAWAKSHGIPNSFNMGIENWEQCLYDLGYVGGKNHHS